MLTLARKNLLKEKGRLAISIGGVAFAVVLIILLRGIYVAYETKVGGYYEAMGVDAWVLRRGCADLLMSHSVLPEELQAELKNTEGVADVTRYLARQLGFSIKGDDVVLYLVAFDPKGPGPGPGPVRMESGTRDITEDEIIVDQVFARKNGLHLGDVLSIDDETLKVAGISSGGDLVVFQYGFVTMNRGRTLLGADEMVNAFLLTFSPGASTADVFARVNAIDPDAIAMTVPAVIKANRRVINESFLPVLGVLLMIGFLIGVSVIGLTIHSAVLEHRREYGVLKAVGARLRQMFVVVAVQALVSAAAGYAVGIGIALLAARAAVLWVPQFITRIQVSDVALVGVAALLMGLIAAVIPLRKIARVDPAMVFRS
ncbi:MAG: ABC transporter permease [Actinomycetes bacterium]